MPASKQITPKLPDNLLEGIDEDAEKFVPGGWVRRRQNPIAVAKRAMEQAEQDGDPRFDYMVSIETRQKFPDKTFLWVPEIDARRMKGRTRGYEECRGGEGITLAGNIEWPKGQTIQEDDLVLMMCDRERKEKRDEMENRANSERRAKIIKRASSQKVVFVDGNGNAPQQLAPME